MSRGEGGWVKGRGQGWLLGVWFEGLGEYIGMGEIGAWFWGEQKGRDSLV